MTSDAERRFLELALLQFGLITRRQARMCGLSEDAVDRRLSGGVLIRAHRRIYRLADHPVSWNQDVMAATLLAFGVASHRTALVLLKLGGYNGDVIDVTTTRRRNSLPSVQVHHCPTLVAADFQRVGPIEVTNATRTLVSVGTLIPENALEEALDCALRNGQTTLHRLQERIHSLEGRGHRGPAALRKLLEKRCCGPAAESQLETRLVQLLRRFGLPDPARQVSVSDESGRVGRIDFAYPMERIAIEVQSYTWHSSRRALNKDAERFNRLQALGWIVILVTYEDLEKHPARVAARIRSALESRRETTSSP